jgi:hypothetical protein
LSNCATTPLAPTQGTRSVSAVAREDEAARGACRGMGRTGEAPASTRRRCGAEPCPRAGRSSIISPSSRRCPKGPCARAGCLFGVKRTRG